MAGTHTDQGTGVEAWEYAVFQGSTDMIATVNDLDVDGWHLVSILSADRGFAAIVRRAIDPLRPYHPAPRPAGIPTHRPGRMRSASGMGWPGPTTSAATASMAGTLPPAGRPRLG